MPCIDLDELVTQLDGSNVLSEPMLAHLRCFTLTEREEIAQRSGTIVVYFDGEVTAVRTAEEEAVLRAMPPGFAMKDLNGLNIGCGDRLVDPSLIAVDIARESLLTQGGHRTATGNALLAKCDNLPFAADSIDFIVALHMLEHVEDPVGVLLHWLDKLKPGGGIGLILPDWRYSWDSRTDESAYGHKWNAEPDLVRLLWENHLAEYCELERMQTYPYKLSFDVILRKPGMFTPFTLPIDESAESGAARHRRGAFLSLRTPSCVPDHHALRPAPMDIKAAFLQAAMRVAKAGHSWHPLSKPVV
jgi:SAM-dependent methyltransferase